MRKSDDLFSRETVEAELAEVHFRTGMANNVIREMKRGVPFLEREIRIPVPVAALSLVLMIGTVLFPIVSDLSPHQQQDRVIVTQSGVFPEKWLERRSP